MNCISYDKPMIFHTIRFSADLIFITRPILLIPAWGFTLLGMIRFLDTGNDFFISVPFLSYLLIGLSTLSVATVYVLNQLADIETDKKNEGFALLAHGGVSHRIAWMAATITAALSIFIPLFFGAYFFSIAAIATIILGVAYSIPPLRLSGRPFFDFISNGFGYGIIAFGAGWILAGGNWNPSTWLFPALPYFLLMCAGSISSTIPDMAGDQVEGKVTTTVLIGAVKGQVLAFLFILLAGILGYFTKDFMALLSAGITLPIYIWYFLKPNQKSMEATYKIGGMAIMVLVGLRVPVFAIASIVITLLTMAYFRYFHNIRYPSLLPAERISDKKD